LFGLVDRTRTRAGRDALRQRLVAPGESAEHILALQRAHQLLAADAASYRVTLDRVDSDSVERYLIELAAAVHQTRAHAGHGWVVATALVSTVPARG
jgi:hypothetical protein